LEENNIKVKTMNFLCKTLSSPGGVRKCMCMIILSFYFRSGGKNIEKSDVRFKLSHMWVW